MKYFYAIAAIFTVSLFIGCANHEIVSDINTSEVTVSGRDSFTQLADMNEQIPDKPDDNIDSADENSTVQPKPEDKVNKTNHCCVQEQINPVV